MNGSFQTLFIIGILTLIKVQLSSQKDQYTDENRPYEFSFTIENEQHRYEKKDINGIIDGEFGFITGDGVYHVSVYATDQSGSFKILSMKNVKISGSLDQLADGIKSIQKSNIQQYGGRSALTPEINRKFEQRTAKSLEPSTPPTRTTYKIKSVSTIRPGCSGCGILPKATSSPLGQPFGNYKKPERGRSLNLFNNLSERPPIKNAIRSSFGIASTPKPFFTNKEAAPNIYKASVQQSIPTVTTYTPSVYKTTVKEEPKSFFTSVNSYSTPRSVNSGQTVFTSSKVSSFRPQISSKVEETPKTFFTSSKLIKNELGTKPQTFFTPSKEVHSNPPQTFFTSNKPAVVSQTYFGVKKPAILETTNVKSNNEFTPSKLSPFISRSTYQTNSPVSSYKPVSFIQPSAKPNIEPKTVFTSFNAPSVYQKNSPQIANTPTFTQPSIKAKDTSRTFFTSSPQKQFELPRAQTNAPPITYKPTEIIQPRFKPNYEPSTFFTPSKPVQFTSPQIANKPTFTQPSIKTNEAPRTFFTSSTPKQFEFPKVQTNAPPISYKPAEVKPNYEPSTFFTSSKPVQFTSPQISNKPAFAQPSIKTNDAPRTFFTSSTTKQFELPRAQTNAPPISYRPAEVIQPRVKPNYETSTFFTSSKPVQFTSPQISNKPAFAQPSIKTNDAPRTFFTSSTTKQFELPRAQTNAPPISYKPNHEPSTFFTSNKPVQFTSPQITQKPAPVQSVFTSNRPTSFSTGFAKTNKPTYNNIPSVSKINFPSNKPTVFNTQNVPRTNLENNYQKVIATTRKSTNIFKTGTVNNTQFNKPGTFDADITPKTISSTNTQILDRSRHNSPNRVSIVRKSSSLNIHRENKVVIDSSIKFDTPQVTTLISPAATSYHVLSKKSTYPPVEPTTTFPFPSSLNNFDSVTTNGDVNPTTLNINPTVHNTPGSTSRITTTRKTNTDSNNNRFDPPSTNYRPNLIQPIQTQDRRGKSLQFTPSAAVKAENGNIYVPGKQPIPIKDKYPNMQEGLPPGITEGDIVGLLYKFNYTVVFHGHYERGWTNGTKVGGYFINGGDGYSRIVTYVADENGYRPKFRLVNLGFDSNGAPKPESEKAFGLNSFEFVWYPIE